MVKKNGDFHSEDIQQAMRLAQTDTAKQLLARLRASNGEQLQSAMNQAAAGDMTQAKVLLEQIMSDPQAQALLRQLKGDSHG